MSSPDFGRFSCSRSCGTGVGQRSSAPNSIGRVSAPYGIEELFPNPSNPRVNDAAVAPVEASVRRFGWQQPVVAKPSGEIVAGHTRLQAAQRLGVERVPVLRFEGSDLDAVAYAIADNRTHEFAEWDEASLGKLLTQLAEEDALEGVGSTEEEIELLLMGDEEEADLDDPEPGEPPEKPVSQMGDMWILGDHRLLCGDSQAPENYDRLMLGEQADRAQILRS